MGNGIGAYAMQVSYPLTMNFTKLSGSLNISASDAMTYLYIGSINNSSQLAGLIWAQHINPNSNSNTNTDTPTKSALYGISFLTGLAALTLINLVI
jgi:hypothetical protein